MEGSGKSEGDSGSGKEGSESSESQKEGKANGEVQKQSRLILPEPSQNDGVENDLTFGVASRDENLNGPVVSEEANYMMVSGKEADLIV